MPRRPDKSVTRDRGSAGSQKTVVQPGVRPAGMNRVAPLTESRPLSDATCFEHRWPSAGDGVDAGPVLPDEREAQRLLPGDLDEGEILPGQRTFESPLAGRGPRGGAALLE